VPNLRFLRPVAAIAVAVVVAMVPLALSSSAHAASSSNVVIQKVKESCPGGSIGSTCPAGYVSLIWDYSGPKLPTGAKRTLYVWSTCKPVCAAASTTAKTLHAGQQEGDPRVSLGRMVIGSSWRADLVITNGPTKIVSPLVKFRFELK
jgi:hypothetical protein